MPEQDWLLTVVLVEVALIAALAGFSTFVAAFGRARRRARACLERSRRAAAPTPERLRLVAASA